MATKKTARKTAKPAAETVANDFVSGASFNAANDQFQTVLNAFSENAETFREQTEDAVAAFKTNVEAAQTRFQTVSADLVEAARTETAEAVTFVNELARAKTIGDALEIQRNYWTNLFDARVERTREFAKTTADVARESFEPFSKNATAVPAFTSFEKFFPFAAK